MTGPSSKITADASREKFLSLSLESTRKSYYPQLLKQLESLKENRRRLQVLIDNLPARISYIDTEKRFVFANRMYEKHFGIEHSRVIGQHLKSVLGEGNYRKVERHIDEALCGKHVWLETTFSTHEGEELWLEAHYIPDITPLQKVVGLYALVVDITDKKRAEAEKIRLERKLQQAQKMESIGTLAGGIAHDFNNILAPLIGFAELLDAELPPDSPFHDYATGILEAAFRAKDMVKQILAFSRQSEKEVIPLRLQPILKEAIRLLRSSIPSTIEIAYDIRNDCGIVMADPTQIHQVVMNLSTNAYHAMENSGGRLEITLEQVFLESVPSLPQDLTPGHYALLRVSDTGIGIHQDILEKIFDPYFTTKGKNKGTGLGLSVVQGIVKNFHGDIRLVSEPGKGTVVSVYLPIVKQKDEEERKRLHEPVSGGNERVLLVDDEESVVSIARQMLTKLGYRVTACSSSVEALEVFCADPDGFDIVLTDMTMPVMTGAQLSREVRIIRPKIPIIICTGFSDLLDEEKIKALGIQGLLMKPLLRREIASAMRKAIDAFGKQAKTPNTNDRRY